MSLKSGLLAESTWAIDALNILLYDDSTIAYFHLKHFPGLINILLEHFLKCLKLIFNETNGNEFNDLFINDYHQYLTNSIQENEDEEEDCVDYIMNESKKEDVKKQLNGYHHSNNNNNLINDNDETSSSSYCSSTSNSKSSKLNTKDNKYINNESLDKYKIMKINFNDKITRKRFLHYYKSFKFNDSNCFMESFDYNNKLLSKYQHQEQQQQSSITSNKTTKITNNELNNYIMTSLNTNDDLKLLNELFYGKKFYEQKRLLIEESNSNLKNEIKTKKFKSSEIKEEANFDFIKLHQEHISTINGNNKNEKLYDDQAIMDEEQIFKLNNQRNIELINRCISISTIFRNLSFVPGNDIELCKNNLFLKILARLLIFKHKHKIVINKNKNSDIKCHSNNNFESMDYQDHHQEEEQEQDDVDNEFYDQELNCIKELMKKNLFYENNSNNNNSNSNGEWWSECVQLLRENTLVTIANLSASINLNNLDEDIIELFSHGLFHWSICKSNDAQDSMSSQSDTSLLSAQRLAIESLSKMTINEINIDLILTTMSRMQIYVDMLIQILCSEWLIKRDDQTNREFSIVLVTALAKCDQFAARSIAKYSSFLISFLEDFEEIARLNRLLNSSYLPNQYESNINEDNLGTTIDMLRRCSNCLMYLALYNENKPLIIKYENRLLDLITSPFVDFRVCQTLTEVLHSCSSTSNSTAITPVSDATNTFKYSFLVPAIQTKL